MKHRCRKLSERPKKVSIWDREYLFSIQSVMVPVSLTLKGSWAEDWIECLTPNPIWGHLYSLPTALISFFTFTWSGQVLPKLQKQVEHSHCQSAVSLAPTDPDLNPRNSNEGRPRPQIKISVSYPALETGKLQVSLTGAQWKVLRPCRYNVMGTGAPWITSTYHSQGPSRGKQ